MITYLLCCLKLILKKPASFSAFMKKYIFFNDFLKFTYLFWETESELKWGKGRERRRKRESQAGSTSLVQGQHGAQPTKCEIMSWAEIKSQTLNGLSHPGLLLRNKSLGSAMLSSFPNSYIAGCDAGGPQRIMVPLGLPSSTSDCCCYHFSSSRAGLLSSALTVGLDSPTSHPPTPYNRGKFILFSSNWRNLENTQRVTTAQSTISQHVSLTCAWLKSVWPELVYFPWLGNCETLGCRVEVKLMPHCSFFFFLSLFKTSKREDEISLIPTL